MSREIPDNRASTGSSRGRFIGWGMVIILMAALLVPPLLPTAWISNRLTAAVSTITSRPFFIRGGVSLAVLPRPRLVIKGVALADAAWNGDAVMASAERVQVTLRPLSLLWGRPAVDIEVMAPTLSLAVDSQGRKNWLLETAPPPAGQPAPVMPAMPVPAAPPVAGPVPVDTSPPAVVVAPVVAVTPLPVTAPIRPPLILSGATLKHGQAWLSRLARLTVSVQRASVHYVDLRSHRQVNADGLYLDLDLTDPAAPLNLRLATKARTIPFEVNLRVESPAQLLAGDATPFRLGVYALTDRAELVGAATLPADGIPWLEADVEANAQSCAAIFRWFTQGYFDPWFRRDAAHVQARVRVDGGYHLRVDPLSASCRNLTVAGSMAADASVLPLPAIAAPLTLNGVPLPDLERHPEVLDDVDPVVASAVMPMVNLVLNFLKNLSGGKEGGP